jgi:hypothetical protein
MAQHDIGRRFTAAAGLLIALCHLPAGAPRAVESPSIEYSVKAAFLYRFGGFVEWPQTVFASPASPTNLCIVGADPFGGVIDKVVDGQRIGDHPVVIRRMPQIEQNSGCQIMYVASGNEAVVAKALEAVRGENVLTITDGGRTPATTGIINFIIADNRVRFEIDDHAASVNGVTISSKLLDLARTAKRRS